MRKTFKLGKALTFIFVLTLALMLLTFGTAALADTEVRQETHTRLVDAWYGNVTTSDGSISPLGGLELTDRLSQNGANRIEATYSDSRVTSAIQSWVSTADDMAWVLAVGENLPAQQNLRDTFSQYAANSPTPGTLTFDAFAYRGTGTYYLTSWVTTEQGNETSIITHHYAYLKVRYHELNATFTPEVKDTGPQSDEPKPVETSGSDTASEPASVTSGASSDSDTQTASSTTNRGELPNTGGNPVPYIYLGALSIITGAALLRGKFRL